MSRPLPPDVANLVRPMPPDFDPKLEDHGRYVRWGATLNIEGSGPVDVELGYSRAGGKAAEDREQRNLRAGAWQVTELARLGRFDLLNYCLVIRHKVRAGPSG